MANLPQKKLSLVVFMAYLIFTAFFAEYFIVTQSNHEHDHEDDGCCSICHEIKIFQALLEGFGRVGVIVLAAGFILYTKEAVKKPEFILNAVTPIALKVRINS
jgi:hypothetical protein